MARRRPDDEDDDDTPRKRRAARDEDDDEDGGDDRPKTPSLETAYTGLHGVDYVLDIGNDEGNAARSAEAIRAFAERWVNRRVSADLSFLTSRFKAQQRIDFFEQLLGKAR